MVAHLFRLGDITGCQRGLARDAGYGRADQAFPAVFVLQAAKHPAGSRVLELEYVRHRWQGNVESAIQVPAIDNPRRRVAIFEQSTWSPRLPLRHIESAIGQDKPLSDIRHEFRGFP